MTKERAAKIILDMINRAESTFGHSLSTTEIIALKKAYCALNPEPTTNADRIRAMTDEELANCITDDLCDRVCHSPLSCDGNCKIQVLDWLKQEAVDNGACSADETSEKVQGGE